MLQLYTGTPGSGKSYHAVREGLWQARRKLVVANFVVTDAPPVRQLENGRWVGWMHVSDDDMTVEAMVWIYDVYLREIHRESSALWIMDEAQRKFNTREWNQPERKSWVTFASLHRHLGFDGILVVQDLSLLDGQMSAMCQEQMRHRRVNRHMPFKMIPFMPPVFATVTYQMHTKLKGELGLLFLKKKVAARYDSLQVFDMSRLSALVGLDRPTPARSRAERGPARGAAVGARRSGQPAGASKY